MKTSKILGLVDSIHYSLNGKSILVVLMLFLVVSCDQNSIPTKNIQDKQVKPKLALNEFEQSFAIIKPLFKRLRKENNFNRATAKPLLSGKASIEYPLAEKILNRLSQPSFKLLTSYGFTNEDFKEMFGSDNYNLIRKKIAGTAILLYELKTANDQKHTTGIIKPNLENPRNLATLISNKRPKWIRCFLEATGIAAGVALIGALAGHALCKTATVAAIKALLKKIGAETISGIGLILIAAEYTWCMLRGSDSNHKKVVNRK